MIALTHRRAILSSGQIAFVVSCIVVLFQLQSFEIASLTAFGAYVLVGTLIAVRRPDNLLGLLLVAYGAGWGLVTAGYVTAESLDEAGHLESASWVSLVAAVLSIPMFWVISAMWLLFPDGRTHSVLARKLLGRSGVPEQRCRRRNLRRPHSWHSHVLSLRIRRSGDAHRQNAPR